MAYPFVFRAQAPPVRVEDHKAAKDAARPVPQAREPWPAAGASGSARPHGAGARWLGGLGSGERLVSAYDLVETMQYLYVRVVKARGLPVSAVTGGCSRRYVEARVGNYRGATRHVEGTSSPEWNQVFAFSRDRVQATALEVFVRDKDALARGDDCVGRVAFDITEAPARVPPDSPLAPQWYRLEGTGGKMAASGEVMLAVWVGTQADEAFGDAWLADAASIRGGGGAAAVHSTRSKV